LNGARDTLLAATRVQLLQFKVHFSSMCEKVSKENWYFQRIAREFLVVLVKDTFIAGIVVCFVQFIVDFLMESVTHY
jgi:uncharacterized ion transporter superfamily protein YfcC